MSLLQLEESLEKLILAYYPGLDIIDLAVCKEIIWTRRRYGEPRCKEVVDVLIRDEPQLLPNRLAVRKAIEVLCRKDVVEFRTEGYFLHYGRKQMLNRENTARAYRAFEQNDIEFGSVKIAAHEKGC